MARSVLSEDRFQNEDAAFAWVEAALWPHGPVCPHCGNVDAKRIKKMEGKTTRRGLYNCKECRKPFTVRVGTIFEFRICLCIFGCKSSTLCALARRASPPTKSSVSFDAA